MLTRRNQAGGRHNALWQGGLGSFVLTAAAIRAQDTAAQAAIRAAFERRIDPYRRDRGFAMPIAFKVGRGRKAT